MEQTKIVKTQECLNEDRVQALHAMAGNPSIKVFCRETVQALSKWRTYMPAVSCGKYGRVFATHQPSIARISKNARAYIAQGEFIDFDLSNAHPTIVSQTLKKIGVSPPKSLLSYMANREDWLSMADIPRDIAKTYFITIMYGGKSKNFMEKHGIQSLPKKWLQFETEFNKIEDKIYNHYKDAMDIPQKDNVKPSSRILSIVNQSIENQILMAMIKSFARQCGIPIMETETSIAIEGSLILMYDGFMAKCSLIDPDADIDDLIETMEEDVARDTGYTMTIMEKPIKYDPDAGFGKYKMNTADNTRGATLEFTDEHFSPSKFINLETYEEKKVYFERFHYKVNHLFYFKSSIAGEYRVFKQCEMTQSYQNVLINEDGKMRTFLDKYLKDPNAKYHNDVIFEPGANYPSSLNLFSGFPKIPNPENAGDLMMADFMRLCVALCESDEAKSNLFLDFVSHILKYPERKTEAGIAFILVGKQGIGKSLLMDLIRPLFGSMFGQVSDLNDIFGKFANAHQNKLLMNLNEADDRAKSMFSLSGMIKSFITEPRTTIEYKGKDRYAISNYCRIIITTNTLSSMPIAKDDRRFIAFEGKDILSNNKELCDRLVSYKGNPEFLGHLNAMLHGRNPDISQFDARKWKNDIKDMMMTVQDNIIDTILGDINETADLTDNTARLNDEWDVPIMKKDGKFLIALKDLRTMAQQAYQNHAIPTSRKFNAKVANAGIFDIYTDKKNKLKHIVLGDKNL